MKKTKAVKKAKKSAKKVTKNTKKAVKKIAFKGAKPAKKTAAKKAKTKKRAAAFTAKFNASPVTERAKKVFDFLKKNGPSTIQQVGDGVFARERPASKRNSWVRNQLRVLRGNKRVKHWPRKGDKLATYEAVGKLTPSMLAKG